MRDTYGSLCTTFHEKVCHESMHDRCDPGSSGKQMYDMFLKIKLIQKTLLAELYTS